MTVVFSSLLSRCAKVRHGFGTRLGGVSAGIYASCNTGFGSADNPDCVVQNRAAVLRAAGLADAELVTLYQCHSARVVVVTPENRPGSDEQADALVCAEPGFALGVLSADCAPVLLADPVAGVVGAAHSGWKGTLENIVLQTVVAMKELGARPENIRAVVGPCIAQASYEVDAAFHERFMAVDEAFRNFFTAGRDREHWQFDLAGAVRWQLLQAGVEKAEAMPHDTYREEALFFSNRRRMHRGEPDYGRQMSVIGLVE